MTKICVICDGVINWIPEKRIEYNPDCVELVARFYMRNEAGKIVPAPICTGCLIKIFGRVKRELQAEL